MNIVGAALVVGGAVLIHFSVVPIFRDWSAELSWKLHKEFVIVNPDRYIKPSAAKCALFATCISDHSSIRAMVGDAPVNHNTHCLRCR